SGKGELVVEEVRAIALPTSTAPDAASAGETPERELGRLRRLRLGLRGFTLVPLRLWLTSAEIEGPELVWTRSANGDDPWSRLVLGSVEGALGRAAALDAAT